MIITEQQLRVACSRYSIMIQPINTEELLKWVVKVKFDAKIRNAEATRERKLAAGIKPGRPRARDDELIKTFIGKGLTLREIAEQTDHSLQQVQRSVKETKNQQPKEGTT